MKVLSCMKMMLIVATVIFLMACSGGKNTLVPVDIKDWESDKEFMAALEDLSKEDKELMESFMVKGLMKMMLGENIVEEGTTINDLLEAERSSLNQK